MLTPFDHLLIAVFAVFFPLYGAYAFYPRLKRNVADGVPGARVRAYNEALIWQWSLTGAALALWAIVDRPWIGLGLGGMAGWRLWTGVGVAAVAVVLLTIQRRSVLNSADLRAKTMEQLENVSALLPRSSRETTGFMALSVTAGICEEILYRGFLMWYLSAFIGDLGAIIVSSLIFGFGHLYQGPKGMVQTGTVGFILAIVYVVTHSLWVPIFLHAFLDINSGLLARSLLASSTPPKDAVDTPDATAAK